MRLFLGDGFGDGGIALPELRQAHYQPGFAAGILAAGGTLGILIPPSVVLVIYAIIVEASIIKIFQAAIVPGVLRCYFSLPLSPLLFASFRRCRPNAAAVRRRKKTRHPARHTRFVNFWNRYFWFEHGGFHPTPAAGIGVAAVLLYGLIAKRLTVDGLISSLLDTAKPPP